MTLLRTAHRDVIYLANRLVQCATIVLTVVILCLMVGASKLDTTEFHDWVYSTAVTSYLVWLMIAWAYFSVLVLRERQMPLRDRLAMVALLFMANVVAITLFPMYYRRGLATLKRRNVTAEQ